MKKRFKIPLVVFVALAVFYFGVVIYRVPHAYNKRKTSEAVEKIHNTKLAMNDVLGKNLPPEPGAESDKTVAGVDANRNGIRDDVELAIFKEYPNSTKTRAALLQYALALQMEVVQEVVNEETVTAVVEETSRGYDCVGSIIKRGEGDFEKLNILLDFVKNKQINTKQRQDNQNDFYKHLGSYELPSGCDIDLSKLPN